MIRSDAPRVIIRGVFRPLRSHRAVDVRELADEELMALAAGGEVRAFEVIFDRHGGAVFSLAYRMCGQRSMAEDVVQEAFLSLWRRGARYDPSRGGVRPWTLGIVRNQAIDALRRRGGERRNVVTDDGIAESVAAPEDTEAEVLRREQAHGIRAALDRLPAEQRQVIELAYFGGFTHTEMASMLELPVGTVKGRMRLGLNRLRALLDNPAVAVV